MLISDESKKKAYQELKEAVDKFNESFSNWMEASGCRANFGWQYGFDRTSPKALEIQSVDAIVYRKEPPKFETIKSVLEKGETP